MRDGYAKKCFSNPDVNYTTALDQALFVCSLVRSFIRSDCTDALFHVPTILGAGAGPDRRANDRTNPVRDTH